jgi:hypothetical protein
MDGRKIKKIRLKWRYPLLETFPDYPFHSMN